METKNAKSLTTEYSSWESMKQRCLNPNNKHFKNYGGRGISICKKWLTFDGFFTDMGFKPGKDYSLDRIDTNGDYCIENCKWSNRYTQARNRRNSIYLIYKGEKYILKDLSNKVGLHHQTLKTRLLKGMSINDAINKEYKYIKSGKYNKS